MVANGMMGSNRKAPFLGRSGAGSGLCEEGLVSGAMLWGRAGGWRGMNGVRCRWPVDGVKQRREVRWAMGDGCVLMFADVC